MERPCFPRTTACGRPVLSTSAVLLLIFSLLPLPSVAAMAPPHPDNTEYWARYHHNSNHSKSTYVPTHISPHICRVLGDDDCRHADASMALHQQTHYEQHRRRSLKPNTQYDMNILVLLLQWKDHTDRTLPRPYEYQLLLNLRIAKYLALNSYDAMNVWFDVVPWQVTDGTEAQYSFDVFGRAIELQRAFHPLLDELYDTQQRDFAVYDANGDGVIDNLLLIHSGYPAEVGKTDCTNGRQDYQRIWSHALADVSKYNWVSSDGAYRTNAYTFAAGLNGVCGSTPCHTGVLTHEFFHAFAAIIDLYDTSVDDNNVLTLRGRGGVGSLDLMANPYGVGGNDEDFPTHLCPWTKMQLGWLTPINANAQVGSMGQKTFRLRPSELYPDILRINLETFFGTEYLLLENRQRKYFDVKLFGTGLAIYHIDDAVGDQAYRGYPGQLEWPTNGNHYRVAVEQKDGEYHLEHGDNRGDANDFFNVGDKLGPNSENGNTWPNTDTYGIYMGVFPTGVVIEVTNQIGEDIEVTVTIPSQLQAAPMKEEDQFEFTTAPKPDTVDALSGKYQASWFLEDRNAPLSSSQEGNTDEEGVETTGGVGVGFVQRPPERDQPPPATTTTDVGGNSDNDGRDQQQQHDESQGDDTGTDAATTDGNEDGGEDSTGMGPLFSTPQKEPGAFSHGEEEGQDVVDAVPPKESPTVSNSTTAGQSQSVDLNGSNNGTTTDVVGPPDGDNTASSSEVSSSTTTEEQAEDEGPFSHLFVNTTTSSTTMGDEGDATGSNPETFAPTIASGVTIREPTGAPSTGPFVETAHGDDEDVLPKPQVIDILPSRSSGVRTQIAGCVGVIMLTASISSLLVWFG